MATHLIGEVPGNGCEIVIRCGLIDTDLDRWLTVAGSRYRRVAVLAQPGSAGLAETVATAAGDGGADTATRVLPDGEQAKRLAVVEEVLLWLNDLGLTRQDLVVGVGGGALTDVAGFVAATYLRGIDAILVPTTLLGAVDAAIGGKTGVNVGGKNLAGAFRHPRRVLVDPGVLEGLPAPLLRQGAAEALKAGFIADPELVGCYERHGLDAPLDEVVERAVAVKVGIVNRDFTEHGVRGWLNYGHTVGHAVETVTGISHGDAVAVGMVAAGAASEHAVGFPAADRQRELITGLGLPTGAAGADRHEVLRAMALDKKRDRSGLRMTLLRDIADPVVAPVDDATVDVALAEVGIA